MPLVIKKSSSPRIITVLTNAKRLAAAQHAPAVSDKEKALNAIIGKAVFFAGDNGMRVAGKAVSHDGDTVTVRLAVPGSDGILYVSDSEVKVKSGDLQPVEALTINRKVASFTTGAEITLAEDRKAVPVLAPEGDGKSAGQIIDYRDVMIDGYASTFVSTTARDRSGDYVLPGAFDKTLIEFMKNPVILCNHRNTCEDLAGSWEKVNINAKGLAVRGAISNAPGMRDVRFKIVEKHLRGLSIGGIWLYNEDGYGIHEAKLYEISLIPIPMNPDALLTRGLNLGDCTKAFSSYWRNNSALRSE